jgi:hypothetical protein
MSDETIADSGTTVHDAGEASVESQAGAPVEAVTSASEQAPVAAPESYTFAAPEGVTLDTAAVEEFSAIAKELGLEQGKAQAIADVAVKMQQRQAEAQQALVTSWVEQVKVDKEIGGDKFAENLAVARKALETFGTPELQDVLNMTGLGNHPEVIRAFYKAGKAISEDRFIPGSPKGPEMDLAKRMFPTMN